MTVFCSACDNVHSATQSLEPWKWRCMKAPVAPGYGFVSPDWSPHPPYDLCSRMNPKGECDRFSPRREAPRKEVNPEEPF